MANSKYEYVRDFEQPDRLLSNTWIVVRLDGRGFTKFTTRYEFEKPNDRRALDLMNAAAEALMKDLPDVVLAYGNSDEFSFVFHKNCTLFERRASKLMTTIVSTFTACYTFLWSTYFPDSPLTPPLPSFDGRCVCYPGDENLRDYMSWRQVDCHINNLYNTTFWSLVKRGSMPAREAEELLKGTVSSDKNEILFSRFGINYNNEPEIFRKGSVLYRDFFPTSTQPTPTLAHPVSPSPPLAHPRPRRSLPRPMSQPLERTVPGLLRDSPLSDTTPRGPTFLSTSTTPSPPPSPTAMSIPTFQNPFPQTFNPVTKSSNGAHSHSNSLTKSPLPQLTPLPLPPPTLKPSTKPPPFLNPPNPTAHTNTSPQPSPSKTETIPRRSTSTTASTTGSTSTIRPSTSTNNPPRLKHRSPSLSILDYTTPPIIPLRISSIPVNNKTRKLSLASQKSGTFNSSEKENYDSKGGKTSAMSTMKELPSPPGDDMIDIRNKVMGGDFHVDRIMVNPTSPPGSRLGPDSKVAMASSPRASSSRPLDATRRSQSHSRLQSAPPTSMAMLFPSKSPPAATDAKVATQDPFTDRVLLKASKRKGKAKVTEEGGWAAGTKELSRTQREKDRKKRAKAKIVIEHVDIIKDEFWEKRPWILSGKAGL